MNGKPELDHHGGRSPLQFNASHSTSLAVVAFARWREIGIDIERIRPHLLDNSLTTAVYSPAEAAAFSALPAQERARAFFGSWTRKEAYLKAIGVGLVGPPSEIAIGNLRLSGDCAARLEDKPEELNGWVVGTIAMPPGYCGAVAIRGGVLLPPSTKAFNAARLRCSAG
jgi:4'-phosphopantetheinyl transferase